MPSAASIPALRQQAPFDVAAWATGSDMEVFPEGTRDKRTLFTSDEPLSDVLKPSWRYLFKESDRRFPDQFWGEIVAYRIGCLLGVAVPPAFAAWNSTSGKCAALIEWFYREGEDRLVLAGNLLQREKPDFDRRRGTDHNMRDNVVLLRTVAMNGILRTD